MPLLSLHQCKPSVKHLIGSGEDEGGGEKIWANKRITRNLFRGSDRWGLMGTDVVLANLAEEGMKRVGLK